MEVFKQGLFGEGIALPEEHLFVRRKSSHETALMQGQIPLTAVSWGQHCTWALPGMGKRPHISPSCNLTPQQGEHSFHPH